MTGPGSSVRRTRGEARLLDACVERGCPVCRCLGEDSARHLGTLLHEHVTDVEVRRALRASRGLCNWHAAMLRELPGAPFGSAIISADLLARERTRAEALGRAARGRGAGISTLRRWLRPEPPPVGKARERRRCPVCESVNASERRYLEALLALVDDPGFQDAFAQGDGLCVPHVTLLMDVGRGAALDRLVSLAAARWRQLEAALQRFIAKHDHRARAPVTDEEGRAWRLALEMLAGAPGVFGDVRHAPPAPDTVPRRTPRPPITSRRG